MTWDQILGLCLTVGVMLIGLLGSFLPVLPGTPVVFAAALLHRLWFGDRGVSTLALVVIGVLMALSIAMDLASGFVGAKKLGATWRGAVGAGVGGLLGIFFSLPGVILGPFVGAVVFEMASGREWREASRAGLGATLGLFAGAIGKIACCLAMIGVFLWSVLMRAWS